MIIIGTAQSPRKKVKKSYPNDGNVSHSLWSGTCLNLCVNFIKTLRYMGKEENTKNLIGIQEKA